MQDVYRSSNEEKDAEASIGSVDILHKYTAPVRFAFLLVGIIPNPYFRKERTMNECEP